MIQEIENYKNNIKKGFGYVFLIQDCSMSFQDSSNSKRSFRILRISNKGTQVEMVIRNKVNKLNNCKFTISIFIQKKS